MDKLVRGKIDSFFSDFPKINLEKGEILISPEEPLFYIYNILSGYIKSYSINEKGLELTINIFKPYSFFPITETLAGKTNNYYFEAVTDVTLQKAPTHKVHEFIKANNDVLFDLTRRISTGLEGFMVRTQYLIRSDASQKIASTMVLLARRFGENKPDNKVKILLPQTHTDIANLAGVSRETASIELKKLERDGTISSKEKIFTVNDFERLKEASTIYNEDQALSYSF